MYMETERHKLQAIADAHGHGHIVEVCGKGLAGYTYSVTRKGKRKLYSVTPLRVTQYFDGRRASGIKDTPRP